ncbi:MAG: trypsin-like peptidase domain-containing protein [Terriglobales bacterium]
MFLRVPFLVIGLMVSIAVGQDDVGRRIYSEASPSVVVLYIESSAGEYVAQGSGFFVAGGKIATNAHVADAGKVFVELGPARLPASLSAVDHVNDLALLIIDAKVSIKPLALAKSLPRPGDVIFAITNPRGLERSISQGLVSATREIEGRELLQVTAPISHGSSGGPILNASGEVVGVAVGAFSSGQNLNFAVPVTLLARLMRGEFSLSNSPPTVVLDEAEAIEKQLNDSTFSDDPDSEYQKKHTRAVHLLRQALDRAGNNYATLLRTANIASQVNSDLAAEAAERAIKIKSTSEAQLLLADAATDQYIFEADEEKKKRVMAKAEQAARAAMRSAKQPSSKMFFRLANVLEDEGRCADAIPVFRSGFSAGQTESDSDWKLWSLRGVIRCDDTLGNIDDGVSWFYTLVKSGNAGVVDWRSHAQRLAKAMRWKEAGDAYGVAAGLGGDYTNQCMAGLCYAGVNDDLALSSSRSCIDKGSGIKNSEKAIAQAHWIVADVLQRRGVYGEALTHSKESTTLDDSQPWYFDTLARSLLSLHRPSEAIHAAKEAIRLADGKYADIHFTLGRAYFDSENWALAVESFKKAAELDSRDDAAAYNIALCYSRMRYFIDAARWYEEVLRRNPNHPDKALILDRIRTLRTP